MLCSGHPAAAVGISKIVAAKAGAAEGLTSAEAGYTWGWGGIIILLILSAVFRIKFVIAILWRAQHVRVLAFRNRSRSQRRRRQRPAKVQFV